MRRVAVAFVFVALVPACKSCAPDLPEAGDAGAPPTPVAVPSAPASPVAPLASAPARAAKIDPAMLQKYAQAIESGDRAQCPTGADAMKDCAAIASGDVSACPKTGEKGCARRVAELAALRRGFGADTLVPASLEPYA